MKDKNIDYCDIQFVIHLSENPELYWNPNTLTLSIIAMC